MIPHYFSCLKIFTRYHHLTRPKILQWVKRTTLFCCLFILTISAAVKLRQMVNLTAYQYHLDCSRMEPLGAWHFPAQIPEDAESAVYHYTLAEDTQKFRLSFTTNLLHKYKDQLIKKSNATHESISSVKVYPKQNRVVFTHHRWKTTRPTSTSQMLPVLTEHLEPKNS